MKGATDYLRYGDLINKPVLASPGGVPRMLETGGMYGGESLFSPQGDYGTTNDDYYSQKGPMYEHQGEELSQKYEALPLPEEPSRSESSESWWTPMRIMGSILMIISIYTLFRHPDSLKLSKLMNEFQLHIYGFLTGFFLFTLN